MSHEVRAAWSRLPIAALLVLTLAALAWSLAAAADAPARVHTFKELRGKGAKTTAFRVVGVKPRTIVRAHLVGPAGRRRVSVAVIRRALRSRRGIVRVRARTVRALRGRSRARAARSAALKVTTAPDTTITGGPAQGSQTTSQSAQFQFSSSAPARATFHCSLNGAAPKPCSSGISYSGLSAGTHRFSVYAVDRYGTADPTPAERSWSVVAAAPAPSSGEPTSGGETTQTISPDTTAPETAITAGPADGSSTTSASVTFSFSGSDDRGVAGYECSLDGAAFAACASPKPYTGLSAGVHTFRVRARDGAGNVDATPATRAWTISPSTPVYRVPDSLANSCTTDVTSQLLTFMATVPNDSTVAFAPGACYRIEGTLELRNRRLILDGNGATFRSFNAATSSRAIWRAFDSTLTFRNMAVVGSYANGGVFADALQHAHAIDLRGTHGVVENVSMSDVAGDCVYFGLGAGRSSGSVRDSSCRRISRNAVSVTAGNDIRVERTTTDRIGYIAFDVEPNSGAGFGAERVVFDSNTIGSYYMKAYTVIGSAPVRDVAFTNNRVVGQGLKIGVVNRTHRPAQLRISGNSSDTPAAPAAMNIDGVDGVTVSGNTVPLTSGTMASVDGSCGVSVSGNAYPGGYREASITNSTC